MLRIPCPCCGTRDESEYSFGGPAHVARPEPDCEDWAWADYLFNRDNPRGLHFERWCHIFGCGVWFNVSRDTVTHEIVLVYSAQDAKPVLEGKRRA